MIDITAEATFSMSDRPSLAHPDVLLATWLGSGYLPGAPGTWGSLAAVPFAAVLAWAGGPWLLLGAALLVVPVGLWATRGYMERTGTHDPGRVVIDEVAGVWLALAAAAPVPEPRWYAAGFLLFRLFDILKPFPVGWADRQLPGAWGVMLDDVLAGAYAAALLLLARWWINGGMA